jgi:hypothetical protein
MQLRQAGCMPSHEVQIDVASKSFSDISEDESYNHSLYFSQISF